MEIKKPRDGFALYQRLPKCYIKKKYKQGIKLAGKILSSRDSSLNLKTKTLAWKALFWGLLGKPEVGIKNIQKGLKENGKSSLCWHIYGKLRALCGEFNEALECYEKALAIAPTSTGVTRDLAFTLLQIGDMDGFKYETGKILRALPQSRQSWLTFAVASHVSGDLEGALNILDSFQNNSHTRLKRMSPWEHSELLLYYNQLIRETGELGRALTHLLENQHRICDSVTSDEALVEMYFQTGQHREALPVVRSLLKRNPNNVNYYDHLFSSLRLEADSTKSDILEKIITDFPNALTPKILFLKFSSGKKFAQSLAKFFKEQLSKGTVNLYAVIDSIIFGNDTKRDYVVSFLIRHKELLSKNIPMSSSNKQIEVELFSNNVCSALVFDGESAHVKAHECIKQAILINPLVADAYVTKAKILKHAMNPTEACRAMEKAQRLEPADRWLEMKLVKYLFRADLVEQADQMYEEFQKEKNEKISNLWYISEKASALYRTGKFDEASALCRDMHNTVSEIENSLFDLHSATLEKGSLRAFEDFLVTSKNLKANKFYLRVAALAVKISIELQDNKLEEYKKLRLKLKKRSESQLKRASSKAGSTITTKTNKLGSKFENIVDDDDSDSDFHPPKGDPNYFQVHLLSARHFLRTLQTHDPNKIETQLLSYEVYSRMRRPLLMMQSLLKARAIDKDHPMLLVPTVRLYKSLMLWSARDMLPQKKFAVLMEMGRRGLWKNRSMEDLTNVFLRKHGKDLRYLLEGAKSLYLLHPVKREDAIRLACYTGEGTQHLKVQTCWRVLEDLKKGTFGMCNVEVDLYRKRCAELFKLSTAFDIDAVKKIRQQDLIMTIENREPIIFLSQDEGKKLSH